MKRVKRVVDGDEQVLEVEDTAVLETDVVLETPTPGVVEKPVVDKDDKGVSFENRLKENERRIRKEYERKLADTEARFESRLTEITRKPVEDDEDDWTKQQRKIAREEQQKARDEDRLASSTMASVLNDLEQEGSKGKYIKRYRSEIEERLNRYSLGIRSSAVSIKGVALQVLGDHVDDIDQGDRAPREERKLKEVDISLDPAPPVREGEITLTKQEIAFADDKRLWEFEYTNAEIRAMYEKRNKRENKK